MEASKASHWRGQDTPNRTRLLSDDAARSQCGYQVACRQSQFITNCLVHQRYWISSRRRNTTTLGQSGGAGNDGHENAKLETAAH